MKRFFTDEPNWFVSDVIVAVLVGGVLFGISFYVQGNADRAQRESDQRVSDSIARQAQLDNNRLYVYTMSSNRVVNASFDSMDLTDQHLPGVHLPGAEFRGAILNGASLRDSDLRGADFWNAEWEEADFSGADLTGAQFGRIGLSSTDDKPAWTFFAANLSHAKLFGMVLEDIQAANFSGAQLSDVDMTAVHPDTVRELVADGAFTGTCFSNVAWPAGLADSELPASADQSTCQALWLADYCDTRPPVDIPGASPTWKPSSLSSLCPA
ncbi:pentapeptide repeat-containing protein [Agromyces humi]|uniref:pentapeptide repeat-containing protein n=1 Tax=Agromyces humi TaxID=1766800 RepID=UPI0013599478|nr:pentapeptide repeat-containing protein [Agromyces humi]